MHGCQTNVTAKAESRLHPRYKQMKDTRPFDGIVSAKSSDELCDQTRLSILSLNAGPKGGQVDNSVVGSFHVILVQEAESHCREIVTRTEQQLHVYQGADQLILFHKNTFEPEGAKIQEEILGTSKHDSFGLKYLLVRSKIQEAAQAWRQHVRSRLLSNTTAKRRDVSKQLLGQLRTVIIAGDVNTSAYREHGKAKVSSIEETWEETLLIFPPDVVPMWGQMDDSGDCCGFISTTRNGPNWRFARNGNPQMENERQTKAADQETPKWRVPRHGSL